MASYISTQTLTRLCELLIQDRSPKGTRSELTRFERELCDTGVAWNIDFCDYLITTESRAWSSIEHFVDQLFDFFTIPQTYLYRRPVDPRDEVSGSPGLTAIDIAALLIGLESVGLQVEPARLVKRLLPSLDSRAVLTSSEIEVVMYEHYVERRRVVLQAKRNGTSDISRETQHTDSAGYRFTILWQGDLVVSLEVLGPLYEQPKAQEFVKCDYCGMEYLSNNTSEARSHDAAHSRHQKVFDPEADQRFAEHLATQVDGERVTHDSPQWMHGQISERASEFRREFGFDFTQWPGSWAVRAGEEWEGRLFAHGVDGTIAGGCAFMQRNPEAQPADWALQWIWIAPKYRRAGLLKARWASLIDRYGDFFIEPPLSAAMEAFVREYGTSKQKAALHPA